jgi:drug/metabolite transporter (DMT)-like permease
MPTHRNYVGGLILALLGVLCVSVAPTLIKVGLTAAIDPVTLLALRMISAAIVFWPLSLLLWPDKLRIDRRGLKACAAVGLTNTISLLCFYLALTRIEASVGLIIFSLYPLAALLMLAVRGERITGRSYIRLGLAILGVYFLLGFTGTVDLLGILFALGAATGYALHMNLIQWNLSSYASQTVALYTITTMALLTTIIRLLQCVPWRPLSPIGWGVVLGTGVVATILARLALFAGIHRVGSGQVALLGPVETFFSTLWAILFLGEQLTVWQWIGGLLIVLSAMLARRTSRPKGEP